MTPVNRFLQSVVTMEANDKGIRALELKARLNRVRETDAVEYPTCVLEILQFLFSPDLVDGQVEVMSVMGRERRDVVFTNVSAKPLWAFLRWEHDGSLLRFAIENVVTLNDDHLFQSVECIGDRLSTLGFIVTRSAPSLDLVDRSYAIFKNSIPRKAILILSDLDLKAMLDLRSSGRDPLTYIQTLYRGFRNSVQ